MVPCHCLLDRPSPDVFKVPTGMKGAEVRPIVVIRVSIFRVQTKGEDSNVTLTHEVHPKSLDAVICLLLAYAKPAPILVPLPT